MPAKSSTASFVRTDRSFPLSRCPRARLEVEQCRCVEVLVGKQRQQMRIRGVRD
jgi:hypothetical protein